MLALFEKLRKNGNLQYRPYLIQHVNGYFVHLDHSPFDMLMGIFCTFRP